MSDAVKASPTDLSAHQSRTDKPAFDAGRDNVRILGLDVHNPVFFVSAALIVAFVAATLAAPEQAAQQFGALRKFLTSTFDWVFLMAANVFVVFALALIVSPYGSIRLGGADAKPEFSFHGWLAMVCAAGMGIGLMFFGVLEPVAHFQKPPLGIAADDIETARQVAMAATIFHWGLHPWAIFGVVALALAFFAYNRGLPLTLRSIFYPLFGERVWGGLGHVIDTLAVFATLFGLATSLGFGSEQALAGLNYLFGIPDTNLGRVVLIAGITALALVSVVAGLDAGVRRLSEINMALAIALLAFVLFSGPTFDLLSIAGESAIAYVQYLPALSSPVDRNPAFVHEWTTFYWAWWISWSPFVGMFIARVSRGRTVRQLLVCVLIVPTIGSIVWMSTFGGNAILQLTQDGYQGVAQAVTAWTPELALFKMLEPMPFATVLSLLGIVLVLVFFITSSDSGSLVVDTITAGGKLHPPENTLRNGWM
ncbi:MAG: BCCT family transporter, partial [Pseudomonadota bacterium]